MWVMNILWTHYLYVHSKINMLLSFNQQLFKMYRAIEVYKGQCIHACYDHTISTMNNTTNNEQSCSMLTLCRRAKVYVQDVTIFTRLGKPLSGVS